MRATLIAITILTGCGSDEIPRGRISFGLPVLEVERVEQYIGVDHDPVVQMGGASAAICTSYDGRIFPWCYDEHHGSDYTLEGGFDAMDSGSATVIAAQSGIVIRVHDGEYDRCHIDGTEVSCDGYPMIANRVEIDHGDGVVTKYLHFMKDSIVVQEGQQVACGETLGLMGSSGNSSLPHVHFQLEVDGQVTDPYAGEYSQPETWWDEQGPPEGLPGPGCTAIYEQRTSDRSPRALAPALSQLKTARATAIQTSVAGIPTRNTRLFVRLCRADVHTTSTGPEKSPFPAKARGFGVSSPRAPSALTRISAPQCRRTTPSHER